MANKTNKKKTNGSVLAGLFKELGGIKGIFSHILKTVNGNQVSKGNCSGSARLILGLLSSRQLVTAIFEW